MSTTSRARKLDPEELDDIVAGLDLEDADAIDRMTDWFADLKSQFRDWLETLTGGDDGWLSRLGDWLLDLLPTGSPTDLTDGQSLLTGLAWLTVLSLVGLVCYGLYLLWLLYRPRKKANGINLPERLRAEAATPLATLPLTRQPAALFAQVCVALADRGRVAILPNSTNQMIAEAAQLPGRKREEFSALASAADRGLFGGWQPKTTELADLVSLRSAILSEDPEFTEDPGLTDESPDSEQSSP